MKYIYLYVAELCPTYISPADLKIWLQVLVSDVGLSIGEAIDLTGDDEVGIDLIEKEDTDLEIDGQREEDNAPGIDVLVINKTHRAMFVKFFRKLYTFRYR